MSSSRISLHDCSLSIRLPILSHTTPKQTSEKIALHAAATPTLDHTEVYTGSTILVLLTISLPHVTSDPRHHFLQHAGDPHIYLVPLSHAASAGGSGGISSGSGVGLGIGSGSGVGGGGGVGTMGATTRLPVLTESSWRVPPGRPLFLVKAVWVLVRAPPERGGGALSGRHELVVELRERLGAAGKNSPVWATIDRASRLFGRTSSLRARKPLLVVSPVDLACSVVTIGGSADRPLVRVVVRNATTDASVKVAAPHINLAASRRVSRRAAVTLVEPHPAVSVLDRLFEVVPLFDVPQLTSPRRPRRLASNSKRGDAAPFDHGLPLPNFDAAAPPAAELRPREVFAFALRLDRRATPDADAPSTTMTAANTSKAAAFTSTMPDTPTLAAGDVVQTAVSIAWSCSRPTDASMPDVPSLRRELSAGGVLATGKRATVAVLATTVEWRPAPLLHGVVISVAGPPVVRVGATVYVRVTVANHTEVPLRRVSVVLQREGDHASLLALRTAVSVGSLDVAAETQVQIPCIALHAGTVALGPVLAVCGDADSTGNAGGDDEPVIRTWVTESEFKAIAVERDEGNVGNETVTDLKVLESLVAR